MPYPPDREALFYVTYNGNTFDKHGYEHVPKITKCRVGRGIYSFTMPHLLKSEIPADQQHLPDELADWLYWKSIVTTEILTNHPVYRHKTMSFEYDVDPKYLTRFPDFLHTGPTLVNEKFKTALDDAAPDTCHFFPVQLFDKTNGMQIDRPMWSLITKHWIHHKRVFDTEERDPKPHPDTDFGLFGKSTSMGRLNYIYSGMQDDPNATAFLHNLGVFSLPTRNSQPIFSPVVYDHLKKAGITGFDEQSNIIHHETPLLEVIGHVWKR